MVYSPECMLCSISFLPRIQENAATCTIYIPELFARLAVLKHHMKVQLDDIPCIIMLAVSTLLVSQVKQMRYQISPRSNGKIRQVLSAVQKERVEQSVHSLVSVSSPGEIQAAVSNLLTKMLQNAISMQDLRLSQKQTREKYSFFFKFWKQMCRSVCLHCIFVCHSFNPIHIVYVCLF